MKYFQGGYLGQKVKCKGLVTIDLFFFFPVQLEIRTNLPIIPKVLHFVLSIYFNDPLVFICRSYGHMCVVPSAVVIVSVTAVTWGANSYKSQC